MRHIFLFAAFLFVPQFLHAQDCRSTPRPPTCRRRSRSCSIGPRCRSTRRSPPDGNGLGSSNTQLRGGEKSRRRDRTGADDPVAPRKNQGTPARRHRPARHRRHQGRPARLHEGTGQTQHHRRRHRRPLSRRARRRPRARPLTTKPSPRPGRPSPASRWSIRSTTTPAGTCGGSSIISKRRDDIDAKNLGMIGFSMGGIQTWLAASVDERIKVAVPAIARAELSLEPGERPMAGPGQHDQGSPRCRPPRTSAKTTVNQKVCRELWNKVIPGILDEYDCPSMLRLFAGRPLLILSGTKDGNCPYGGAKIAIASAEKRLQGRQRRRSPERDRRGCRPYGDGETALGRARLVREMAEIESSFPRSAWEPESLVRFPCSAGASSASASASCRRFGS